jgi:ferritin-like protein
MAGSSASVHEPLEWLKSETVERHRALVSLMEELEAVDWYDQRADATRDEALRAILEHNRDEEKEHAAMTLEWVRRHDAKWDEHLRTYLFTEESITEEEREAEGADGPTTSSLGIGSLRLEVAP